MSQSPQIPVTSPPWIPSAPPILNALRRHRNQRRLTLETMAPEVRRYIANNGRTYTTQAGKAAAAPETNGPDHAPQEI